MRSPTRRVRWPARGPVATRPLHGRGVELGEQRILRGQRIGLRGVCLGSEPLPLEPARDGASHPARHARDLGVVRGRERMEAQASFGAPGVDAVEDQ
jgi:hypothetical protein